MKLLQGERLHGRAIRRRAFLTGAGAAATGLAAAGHVRAGEAAQQAPQKIRLGLIGCGSRGQWIAALFKEHGGFELVAGADYFQDRLDVLAQKHGVPAARLYAGLSGYKKLLASGVDAVAIETPPFFHPEQVAAAVEAGVHVYVAKPVAVDVPGCRSISESGRRATAKKLCVLADFQARRDPFMVEAVNQVRERGALGEIAFGESIYHADDPFKRMADAWRADPRNPENRLRAWGLDRRLSGDIITEQNIHALDMVSWVMGGPPLWAAGTGGRVFRQVGTCWDHFAIQFTYAKGVGVTFSSKQFPGHDTVPSGIRMRIFGAKGVLEAEYAGSTMIRGENFFRGGRTSDLYRSGTVANIAAFHDQIRSGKCDNPTVEPAVTSNLVTLLGRKAAYGGGLVTWTDLMKDDERWDAGIEGLKA